MTSNPYIGNIQYCYANSTAMLLQSIGEVVAPSKIEVLTGVGLGGMWVEEAKLIFFGNWTAAPDRGVSKALEMLGFRFVEAASEGGRAPFPALRDALKHGPVVLGPLDMGHLTYNPNSKYLSGCDHYVLAYGMDEEAVHLHDPAGFPFVSLSLPHLEQAWKAETIGYRRGAYRYWTAPERVESPSEEDVYQRALAFFQAQDQESEELARRANLLMGRDAILHVAERTRRKELTPPEFGHLGHFALVVGAKRALDYTAFFHPYDTQLAALKYQQAQLFGKCQTLFVGKKYAAFAHTLEQLAEVEGQFREALLAR